MKTYFIWSIINFMLKTWSKILGILNVDRQKSF